MDDGCAVIPYEQGRIVPRVLSRWRPIPKFRLWAVRLLGFRLFLKEATHGASPAFATARNRPLRPRA